MKANRRKSGVTAWAKVPRSQVQVVDQTTHPPKCHSFLGLDRQIGSSPLLCRSEVHVELLEAEGGTHT